MADPNENYKKALENVESLLKQQEALNKSADKLKTSWGAISSQIFALDGAAFFKQIPLSVEDIKKLNNKLEDVNKQVKVLGEEFGNALDQDKNIEKFTKLAKF
jgi:antitoxin component HigA of HigAB toxin-antitoxin module